MANCKYYKQKKQYTTDSGATWNDFDPAEYQKGSLYESGSTCIIPLYRWNVDSGNPQTYGVWECDREFYQVSYDDGVTWQNVTPTQSRVTDNCSGSCNCIGIPGSSNNNFEFYYKIRVNEPYSGTPVEQGYWVEGETCGTKINYYTITRNGTSLSAVIGIHPVQTCIGVADYAFTGCTKLEWIVLPCSTTTIGYRPFNSSNMQYIMIQAMDVPSIQENSFSYTNNCPIYVYPNVVDKYKAAWPNLASRIQPITS